jgi:hypothetical protein
MEQLWESSMARSRSSPARRVGWRSLTEEHFDALSSLNARGTLFTVQKALPPHRFSST